jgi:signal peptidase I
MKDTLLIGDHILVNKFIYGVKTPFVKKTMIPIKDPKQGDIIVFEFPKIPARILSNGLSGFRVMSSKSAIKNFS